jgi:hypothetical protein
MVSAYTQHGLPINETRFTRVTGTPQRHRGTKAEQARNTFGVFVSLCLCGV